MNDYSTKNQQELLDIIYREATWLTGPIYACGEGCAACCTTNVTTTEAEGVVILQYLAEKRILDPFLADLQDNLKNCWQPAMTTNHFARLCLGKKTAAADIPPPSRKPCPFLAASRCTIYPVRPFSCRCFVSQTDCRQTGSARVPEAVLMLNLVVHQLIEHLCLGKWGNMIAILAYLLHKQKRFGGGEGEMPDAETVPGFLVPPAMMPKIKNRLQLFWQPVHNTLQEQGMLSQHSGQKLSSCFEELFADIKNEGTQAQS